MKRLAIIPARSGSKGLKDKNITNLCGKPLIVYSIEAALLSGIFDKILVSTDSEHYADISRQYGADVIMRGVAQSNDKATTFDVLVDIFNRLDEEYDYFTLHQPTTPIRNAQHVKHAARLFESRIKEFDFLVSMKESEHAKVLVNPIGEDGSLRYFDTDFSTYRRQESKDYSPNGAIFIGKTLKYLQHKHFFGARSLAYIMSTEDSVDIDSTLDLDLAKVLIARKHIDRLHNRR